MKKNKSNSRLLLDLGLQPVSNRFIFSESEEKPPKFPLKLLIDESSGCIYIDTPFPVTEVRPRYDWLTCFEPEDHLDELVKKIVNLPGVSKQSLFGAYSFKDDSTLERLKRNAYLNTWRIDPILDFGINDSRANVETYQEEFNLIKAKKIAEKYGAVDVMIVRHVIEHSYDLSTFIDSIKALVKPGGYIVWEVPDCEKALEKGDCTTIWEEHTFYFTSFTFKKLLQDSGFSLTHFEMIDYPMENSIIAIVKNENYSGQFLLNEGISISKEIERADKFAESILERKKLIISKLQELRKKKGPIALFGAGHLSVAFLSIMEVENMIDFVIDDNPNKMGMKMPIGQLKIVGSECLRPEKAGICLLGLNPHNQHSVIKRNQEYTDKGGLFASIFPGSSLDLVNFTI